MASQMCNKSKILFIADKQCFSIYYTSDLSYAVPYFVIDLIDKICNILPIYFEKEGISAVYLIDCL